MTVAAPTREQFIQLVYDRLKADGPMDFARKLGLGPDGYQKVNRWTKQRGRLTYEDVVLMLDKAGWGLSMSEDAPPAPPHPDDPLEVIGEIRERIAHLEALERQRADRGSDQHSGLENEA